MTERIEAVIDEVLAAAYDETWNLRGQIAREYDNLHYAAKDKRSYERGKEWQMTNEQAVAAVKERIAAGAIAPYNARVYENAIAKIATYRAQIAEIADETAALREVYQAGPWSRFYIVPGGHIHSSMNCHSCYITTQFGWLPSLSGLTEADAVAEHGMILCTHCYPTAPVEWTARKQGQKDVVYCEGSGKEPAYTVTEQTNPWNGNVRKVARYTCPGCGCNLSGGNDITSRGVVRKHKEGFRR